MNSTTPTSPLRRNFILLLLVTIGGISILCWTSLIILALATGGPIFQNKDELAMDLFMVCGFPFILGAVVSILSVALTALIRQKWWISVPATIFLLGTPLVAYIITWLASWVARIFYLPTPEDAERTEKFLSMSIGPKYHETASDVESIKKMKLLLEEGIITQDEFLIQKQKIVSQLNDAVVTATLPRYFSAWQATIAAVLGGFLAGAILVSINFKRLGDIDKFKGSLLVTLIGHLIAIVVSGAVAMFFTNTYFMLIIPITLAYPIIIYLWHNEAFKPILTPLMETKQARRESWWIVLGIALLALLFVYLSSMLVVLLIALVLPATPT